MNNGEKATSKQIRRLYGAVLSKYKERNGIKGRLTTDTVKQVMDTFKEESGIKSFATLGKREISLMIDEIENEKVEDTESEEVNQEVKKEKTQVKLEDGKTQKTEMEQIAEEMQVAVRYATQIAIKEVQGKIEAQGLASFIQKLATTMFLANKRSLRGRGNEEEFF